MWGRVTVFKNKHWLNRQLQQRKGQNQLDGILAGHLAWQGRSRLRSVQPKPKLYEVSLFRPTTERPRQQIIGRAEASLTLVNTHVSNPATPPVPDLSSGCEL